jgi:hypothetical protein
MNRQMLDDCFVTPLPGLFADLDAGAGCLSLPDEVLNAPAIVRLRVIDGWQSGLEELRRRALADLFEESGADLPAGTPAEVHIDRLATLCMSLGIPWAPHDLSPARDGPADGGRIR